MRAFRSRLGLACLLALLGCSSEKGDLLACRGVAASIAQPITNGTSREEFLALGEESLAAIVAIQNQPWPNGSLCTGVLLHESWVLTASHCLAIPSPHVVIERSAKEGATARVLRAVTHPTLDAALLEIEAVPDLVGDAGVLPLSIGTDLSWLDWVGQRVEIAGYGLTESAEPDGLRFAVETVIEMTDFKLRVDGFGRSGACEGDSGGPMLGRDRDGRPLVLGILSGGEASCFGRDRFIRTDALADWIRATVSLSTEAAVPCGKITSTGVCLFNSALHCEGGLLEASACDEGQVCGWDAGANRFSCMSLSSDPCGGVGSSGRCDESMAVTCALGERIVADCAPCGGCRYSPQSGVPECGELTPPPSPSR